MKMSQATTLEDINPDYLVNSLREAIVKITAHCVEISLRWLWKHPTYSPIKHHKNWVVKSRQNLLPKCGSG